MSSIDLTDPNFLRHHHKLTDMSLLSTLIISWNCDETNYVFIPLHRVWVPMPSRLLSEADPKSGQKMEE